MHLFVTHSLLKRLAVLAVLVSFVFNNTVQTLTVFEKYVKDDASSHHFLLLKMMIASFGH